VTTADEDLTTANRNILYIDEANLLENCIANLILDAAASG
jgi:Mg-chelatase subunit ChlI